ncbi:DUF3137 domain-containing protein [Spiroplasma sp. AdecLV25b]|uniref:DUF3137 domain-containing protein n=1 Tax=Spiroplasma sp. AdecLV25b TaxID=3027162 RepID=UPI0027E1A6CE|nr:DUF3137 domain-containing protein [Spiroplasma sp. AdecLV25b]
MKHNLSPQVANAITSSIHEEYENSNNHWWIKLITKRWWLSLWIIVTTIAIIGIVFLIITFQSQFIKKPMTIISIIILLSAIFLIIQTIALKNKIRDTTLQNLPIQKYYQWVVKDNNSSVTLEKITDVWEIAPQGNLPLDEAPYYFNYCENVMIGTISNQPFNYGSIINQKVVSDYDKTYNIVGELITTSKNTCYYTRFVYYTTYIKNNNLIMTLTPRNLFSKKFHIKKQVQLESNLFENLFEVKCNDQIKLRLLLEPRVIDALNQFAASLNQQNLPIIHIENQQLTLNWKYNLGKDPYRYTKGKIMNLPSGSNYEKFINNLLTIISEDVCNLTIAQTWSDNLS